MEMDPEREGEEIRRYKSILEHKGNRREAFD
jgi:hypothetical protein